MKMDRFFSLQLIRVLIALCLLWAGWDFAPPAHHSDI